jgi:hypothetical protein
MDIFEHEEVCIVKDFGFDEIAALLPHLTSFLKVSSFVWNPFELV